MIGKVSFPPSKCNMALQAGLDLFQDLFGSPWLAQHPYQHAAALIMQAQLADGLQRKQDQSFAEVQLTGSRDIQQELSAIPEGAAAKRAASSRSRATLVRKRAAASKAPEQAAHETPAKWHRQMQGLLTACSLTMECPTLLR